QPSLTLERAVSANEDLVFADRMIRDIRAMHPGFKEPARQKWAGEIRLMREQDKRSFEDLTKVWERSRADKLWLSKLLSPTAFRRHFDKLWVAYFAGMPSAKQAPDEPCAHEGCSAVGKYRVLAQRFCVAHFHAANKAAMVR